MSTPRLWTFVYVILTVGLISGAGWYTFGLRHVLHLPAADIWQHLAAINAITEHPFEPTNPFVESAEPSRLFGPLWVAIGMVCHIFGLDVLGGFWAAGILNLLLLSLGIWLLGTSLFGGPKGALALLIALLGGWLLPPNFTGYHSPYTLLSSPGYPAVTAVASSLILWGLSLRWLKGSPVGPIIVTTAGLAFIIHPLGMVVGIVGCYLFAVCDRVSPIERRLGLAALIFVGIALSATWPYFNPWTVLSSASSPDWGVGIDFYDPKWIFRSLFPAIIGLPFLFRPKFRALLFLLVLCSIGFTLGGTTYFIAGHRLLSWMALILHIGLADALLRLSKLNTRPAIVAQSLVFCFVISQALWTFGALERRRVEAALQGNLLADAQGVIRGVDGGIAGYLGAGFPLTASGQRVLATNFAEPLIADMPRRQRASKRLFAIEDRQERISAATALGVRYLVADVRTIPPDMAVRLSNQATSVVRSGNLVRYQLY